MELGRRYGGQEEWSSRGSSSMFLNAKPRAIDEAEWAAALGSGFLGCRVALMVPAWSAQRSRETRLRIGTAND